MTRSMWSAGYVLLVLFELGALGGLPPPWRFVALAPLGLMGFVVARMEREAWILAALTGLLFDAFSLLPFGIFIVVFLSVVWVTRALYHRWFTNRSWISLVTLIALGELWFLGLSVVLRALLRFMTKTSLYRITGVEALAFVGWGTAFSVLLFIIGLVVRDGVRRILIRRV